MEYRDWDQANSCLKEALELHRGLDAKLEVLRGRFTEARVASQRGDFVAARQAAQVAADGFSEMGAQTLLDQAKDLLTNLGTKQ